MSKKIVNIVSLGHSGSTLLGNILGGHSKVFHIGELVAPIQKKREVICMECQDDSCPIWGGIINKEDVFGEYRLFQLWKSSKLKYRFSRLLQYNTKSIYHKLFDSLDDLQVVVDSSKSIEWYNYQRNKSNLKYQYIFLKREPKAVISSLMRVHNNDVEVAVDLVKVGIKRMNEFYNKLNPDELMIVAYEDLVQEIEVQVKALSNFIGLEEERMMVEFNDYPHHLIGGNQAGLIQKSKEKASKLSSIHGYNEKLNDYSFYKNLKGVSLDMRWKNKLNKEQIEFINNELEGNSFIY